MTTFEGVPEESSELNVLNRQAQEDGLVGAFKLVLSQREVVGHVIDGLRLFVPPDGSGVRRNGRILPAGCTDAHTK